MGLRESEPEAQTRYAQKVPHRRHACVRLQRSFELFVPIINGGQLKMGKTQEERVMGAQVRTETTDAYVLGED